MKYLNIVLICFLCGLLSAQVPKIKPLEIDSPAPGFNLPGTDGKNYTLNDFREYKILVVTFTCNHCPTAQAYEDKIIKAVNDYRDRGVGFVAISPNSPKALNLSELGYSDMAVELVVMKIRAKDKGFDFPYLYDGETQETSIKYGPVATPHVFIFNNERKLKYRGRIDDTENPYASPDQTDMRNALEALIKDQPVPVPVTKKFGCSIKWAWKDEWNRKLLKDWAEAPVELDEIDTAGMKVLMSNNGDKLRLINFWATWCGPCIIEFPELVTIDRMYRNRDFEFMSVSTDKPEKKIKAHEFLKRNEASNKNYIYTGDNIYDLMDAASEEWQGALPFTLLIAPGGDVIFSHQGAINPLSLKKKIINYLGRYYADDK